MARDRKRAKQRRDRRTRPGQPGGGVRTDVRRAEEREELEAPEPLEHASAEVDLAEAQLALGRPELADGEAPLSEEELVEAEQEDEIEHPVARSGAASAPGGSRELPGNRIVSFLLASWRELQRVQWPDRRQVAQATGVVIVFVIVAGLFLGLVDAVSQKLVDAIL